MIDVGIHDGDLLAVHQTQQVTNGQIVVARIGDEVTVKRFHKAPDSHIVELIAENPEFEPIIVDLTQESFAIEGLSVGVIRRS
jgi:repressor LexA